MLSVGGNNGPWGRGVMAALSGFTRPPNFAHWYAIITNKQFGAGAVKPTKEQI